MKKKILWGLGIVVALLVVVMLVVIAHLGGIVKAAIERVGPSITGTPVTLELAAFRPVAGQAQLQGLVVGNPDGYKTDNVMELDDLKIDIDMASLKSDTVVIESILVDGPVITYEKSLKKSNLAQLLDNVRADAVAKPEPEVEERVERETREPAKRVVIESLIVQNGKIRLSTALLMGKSVTIALPKIELQDLGKEKDGIEISEAVGLVLGEVFESVFAAVAGSAKFVDEGAKLVGKGAAAGIDMAGDAAGAAGELAGDTVDAAGDIAGDAVDAAGDLAGDAAGAAGEGVKAIGKGASKIAGGLGGMFKKSEKDTTEDK